MRQYLFEDRELAEELLVRGFSVMRTMCGTHSAYATPFTEELDRFLKQNYSAADGRVSNFLAF